MKRSPHPGARTRGHAEGRPLPHRSRVKGRYRRLGRGRSRGRQGGVSAAGRCFGCAAGVSRV